MKPYIGYCNGCKYLDPQEEDQTPDKEPHICRYWNFPLYHDGHHPGIPHRCPYYEVE